CGGAGQARDAGLADRSRVLAILHEHVRGGRIVSVGEFHLERADVSARHSHASAISLAGWRVPRRWSRAELYLHRESETSHGGDLRHSSTERHGASDVQGAVRAVADARGVRFATVLASAVEAVFGNVATG